MTQKSPWTRARSGLPVAVLGFVAQAPDDVTVVHGRLDRGPEGLAALASALAPFVVPPSNALATSLAERLVLEQTPAADGPLLGVLGDRVAVLSGAEAVHPDLMPLLRRWLAAATCPLILVATTPCPVTRELRTLFGDAAIITSTSPTSTAPMGTDDLAVLLVALQHEGELAIDACCEAWGCPPILAMARLEAARLRGLPLHDTASGLCADRGWLEDAASHLSASTLQRVGRPTSPTRALTAREALALGCPELAITVAESPVERAAIAWSIGRTTDLRGLPPAMRLQVAWAQDDREQARIAIDALPQPALLENRALWIARYGSPENARSGLDPAVSPWAVAALPKVATGHHTASARDALRLLLARTHEPSRRGLLTEWYAQLFLHDGDVDAAAVQFGAALPDLHHSGSSVPLARAVAGLAKCLGEAAGRDLLGWLEAAVQQNVGHPKGLTWCGKALATLQHHHDATDTELDALLRRLELQLSTLHVRPSVASRAR